MVRFTPDFWALDIRLELSWLRTYLDVVERHLASLPDDPPPLIQADLQSPDDDVSQPMRQEWGLLSEEAAPRLARGSFLVALYAAYESGITELAQATRLAIGADLALEDIKGRHFLESARKYFDKVLGIPLCPNAGQWSTLGELSLLRHLFAHANGRIGGLSLKGQRVFAAMQRRGDATESWGSILLTKPYVERMLEVVDVSMRDLIERTKGSRPGVRAGTHP